MSNINDYTGFNKALHQTAPAWKCLEA